MWTTRLLKLGFQLSNAINAWGLARFKPVRSVRHRVRALVAGGDVLIAEVGGQEIYVPNTVASVSIYFSRRFERYTIDLFKSAVKPGSTVVDIGAHIGCFSLIASKKAGKTGKVHAFEPAPENFALLGCNARTFGTANMVLVQKAVGNRVGRVPLFLAEGPDMNGLQPHPLSRTVATIEVECTTIDHYLSGLSADVIKMDVEGYEPYALAGMARTISESKDLVLFSELNPICMRRAGVEPWDFVSRLKGSGFRVQLIDEERKLLRPMTASLLEELEKVPYAYANLYCVKQ